MGPLQFENFDQVPCSLVKFCYCTVILCLENILVINRIICLLSDLLYLILSLPVDPYLSVAMLSLGGIKSFVFAQQVSARCEINSVQGLPCENKTFYSPETQHGCRVIKVYCWLQNVDFCCFLGYFPEQWLVIEPS